MARTRFDIDALRRLAGDQVFARGEAYHDHGQVEILAIDAAHVLARVSGTDDYRTELSGRGRSIGGACSCPAFESWGFCKHMVAAALAANAGGEAEAGGEDGLSRIRAYLRAKGVDALVDMIVDLAERDFDLFRKLDMATALARADDKAVEPRMRKAIDQATRTRRYITYGEAADWAAEVDAALDAVAALTAAGRAGIALRLVEHAIDRIGKAIGQIDDSDGYCSGLLHRARDIHVAAARAARPEPVELARNLFACEIDGDHDTFTDAATLYADVLGERGLAEYRRLAAREWEKLPPRSRRAGSGHDFCGSYHRLIGILDVFAEHDGDVDARIALRVKDLSSPWSYLELAEFCVAQGREDEALRRAEEGLWMFEDDRPDERLVLFAVDLLSKAGRTEEARGYLRRAFEKAPSLELYARLHTLGGDGECAWAVGLLESALSAAKGGRHIGSADLLIRIHIRDESLKAAWAALGRHGASMSVKETLARASEAAYPREAAAVYAERVDHLAHLGGGPAYVEAIRLVSRMAALRSAADQAAYVAALKERFGRKRNFMKLLG